MNDDVDLPAFLTCFAEAAGVADPASVPAALARAPNVPATFAVERHRHRLSLLVCDPARPLAALETVKVADVLLLVTPAVGSQGDDVIDADADVMDDDAMDGEDLADATRRPSDTGSKPKSPAGVSLAPPAPSPHTASTLAILRAQGFPPGGVACAILGLDAVVTKKRAATRNAAARAVTAALQIPADRLKHSPFDRRAERLDLIRLVAETLRGTQPRWRSQRAYVMAERAVTEAEDIWGTLGPKPAGGSETVTVKVEGFVRGAPLSANQLMHLPGVGDFPIERVEAAKAPGIGGGAGIGDAEMESNIVSVLATPDPSLAEAAVRENVPDALAGEQTWPTEEEMAEADVASERRKKKPRGWSDYQAAWIPDSDDDDENGDDEKDDYDVDETMRTGPDRFGAEAETREGGGDEVPSDDDASDEEWVANGNGTHGSESEPDEETVANLDAAQRDSARRSRLLAEEEEEELDFPDEVETPSHMPARERFARYRGLKSFRSSPWDPKEQLPADYARVFAFENFRRAAKRAVQNAETKAIAGVPVGAFVRVVVRGVPRVAAEALLSGAGAYKPVATAAGATGPAGAVGAGGVGAMWNGWCGGAGPVILSSLLQHESKLTVMHYGVTKHPAYEPPLRSKTPLWFHVGFRRERAVPIFSTDGMGDKHKFERFLHARRPSVASVYAPVAYPPAPVLGFKERVETSPKHGGAPEMGLELVLSGSVRRADPDRIILKRCILTGVPFKTHKSKAVVRHMFFNPEDIRWFKPLELWTKYGMRGKIKDAIGTHGHMKCLFNGVIQQRDTICATMYKRVYPKFLNA